MFGWIAASLILGPAVDSTTLGNWGGEALEQIKTHYFLTDRGLYSDRNMVAGKPDQPAFTWGVGVMLSALNAAARWDPQYKSLLRDYADKTRIYWNELGPVPGYDVLPGPKPVDRYYDDNAWMVMALVETSEILKNKKYLLWAEDTLAYVLSGEDDKLGGGIYWKEAEKSSKNCCSNGPSVAACLTVYSRTNEHRLLVEAEKLYAWTKEHFQDTSDHLFWDGESLSGHIEKHKWTYNTALMLRSASELFRITKTSSYAIDAKAMLESSISQWLKTDTGALNDEGKFAHLLLDSWVYYRRDVREPGQPTPDLSGPLAFTHGSVKSESGFYGGSWGRQVDPNQTSFELIDQASAVRGYFQVAITERN